jgi:hypothetical protein
MILNYNSSIVSLYSNMFPASRKQGGCRSLFQYIGKACKKKAMARQIPDFMPTIKNQVLEWRFVRSKHSIVCNRNF